MVGSGLVAQGFSSEFGVLGVSDEGGREGPVRQCCTSGLSPCLSPLEHAAFCWLGPIAEPLHPSVPVADRKASVKMVSVPALSDHHRTLI